MSECLQWMLIADVSFTPLVIRPVGMASRSDSSTAFLLLRRSAVRTFFCRRSRNERRTARTTQRMNLHRMFNGSLICCCCSRIARCWMKRRSFRSGHLKSLGGVNEILRGSRRRSDKRGLSILPETRDQREIETQVTAVRSTWDNPDGFARMTVERSTALDELVSTIEWEGKEHRFSCSRSDGMCPSVAIDPRSIETEDRLAAFPRGSNRSFDRSTETHSRSTDSLFASLTSAVTNIAHRLFSQSHPMFLVRQ